MKNIQRRVYMTKRRKTQKLYKQIIIWTVLACLVGIAGTWNHHVLEHKNIAREAVEAIKANVHVEKVKAETVDHIREEAKMVETVEQMIRRIAKEENFKWPDYLVKLAHCESRLDPKAVNDRNNNPSHSKDRGLFQINNHWHSEVTDEQAYNPEWATKWTIKMINEGRQGQWACDRLVKKTR